MARPINLTCQENLQMNEIQLFSGAWYGDRQITIRFPASWDVEVVGDKIHPVLKNEMIEGIFSNPIGSPSLSEPDLLHQQGLSPSY